MQRLRKLRQLTARDWIVLGQAWVLFPVLGLGLYLFAFRTLLTLCRWWSGSGRLDSVLAPEAIDRAAWLTEVAGRYSLVRSTCLKRALVLSILLERRGVSTKLRIGVSRHTGSFTAHAWLEENDRIVLGLRGRDAYETVLL
jgi:hypothetical protein